jgi:hypothetical protein
MQQQHKNNATVTQKQCNYSNSKTIQYYYRTKQIELITTLSTRKPRKIGFGVNNRKNNGIGEEIVDQLDASWHLTTVFTE